jgi:hypothetical protein
VFLFINIVLRLHYNLLILNFIVIDHDHTSVYVPTSSDTQGISYAGQDGLKSHQSRRSFQRIHN